MNIQRRTSRVTGDRVRRRWIVVGPGLVLAVLGSALLLTIERTETTSGERPSVTTSVGDQQLRPTPPPPAPEIAFVLRVRERLHLTDRQSRQLGRLKDQYDRETQADRVALAQASGEFARQMQLPTAKPVLLSDIQDRTARVSQLSRRLSTARRACWTRAIQILTPVQRDQAEALWVHQLQPKGETASGLPVKSGAVR